MQIHLTNQRKGNFVLVQSETDRAVFFRALMVLFHSTFVLSFVSNEMPDSNACYRVQTGPYKNVGKRQKSVNFVHLFRVFYGEHCSIVSVQIT